MEQGTSVYQQQLIISLFDTFEALDVSVDDLVTSSRILSGVLKVELIPGAGIS